MDFNTGCDIVARFAWNWKRCCHQNAKFRGHISTFRESSLIIWCWWCYCLRHKIQKHLLWQQKDMTCLKFKYKFGHGKVERKHHCCPTDETDTTNEWNIRGMFSEHIMFEMWFWSHAWCWLWMVLPVWSSDLNPVKLWPPKTPARSGSWPPGVRVATM